MELSFRTASFLCCVVMLTKCSLPSGEEANGKFGETLSRERKAKVNKRYNDSVSQMDDSGIVFKFEHVRVRLHENIQIELSVFGEYDREQPPVFAVLRTSQNIMSFQVPVVIGDRVYSDVSRTLCTPPDVSSELNTFFIGISTLSNVSYNFSLATKVIDTYQLKATQEGNLMASPSQPQVLPYELQSDEDTVLVKFESEDELCSIVSVQNALCPVYDQADDVAYEGFHQYFTKKAGIAVSKRELKSHWFFIVVIVVPSVHSCSSSDHSLYPLTAPFLSLSGAPPGRPSFSYATLHAKQSALMYRPEVDVGDGVLSIFSKGQSKRVNVTISKIGEKKNYLVAILTAGGAFSMFYVLFFVYAIAEFCQNKVLRAEVRRQTGDFDYSVFPSPATAEVVNYAHLVENAPAVVLSNPVTGGSSSYNEVSESEANNLANGRTPVATPVRNEVATLEENRDHRSATAETVSSCSSSVDENDITATGEHFRTAEEGYAPERQEPQVNPNYDSNGTSLLLPATPTVTPHQHVANPKSVVYLSDMSRKRPNTLQRKYRLYFWTLVTVAIFYSLPVIYLMISYQIYFDTGNQDFCYYNFWCQNPYFVFASFNSLVSNMGYVMLGILYFLIVYTKEVKYKLRVQIDPELPSRGIPKHFGMFYAIALALCMEGVMSACYHLCPNGFNFQFDVSFMYMIGGLGTLRMYQSRHPDVNANSHAAFLTFAVVIAVSVCGVVLHSKKWFWVVFVIVYLSAVFYVTCQVYFIKKIKLDWKVFHRIVSFLKREYCVRRPWREYLPNKPDRFGLLLIGNIINWTIGIGGLVVRPSSFGSLLLSIFVVNLLLYFMFYIIMKLRFKERVHYTTAFLGMTGLCTWLAALYFYSESNTNWQLSPAKSRELNKGCVLLDFYDNHDIWHFLSAISLFVSFLIVLILDDDLDSVERCNIKVF
ncbi:SID1 transmembrane family member 2-like isoform X2 [Convolutriloba macropyga]|uniref:SID1 transmembrane family member 2-like isoform X2 n=1 Tax=Convolutriloba macropyga TaxID=536237 RepID=UPI003F5209A4